MKILKAFLVGFTLIAGVATVSAQEAPKKTPQERAEMHTERMTKALELTPDQRSKVAEMNLGVAFKNDAIRKDANMTKEQKQASIKSNNESRMAQLKNILTEEQYKKAEAHQADMQVKKAKKKEKNTKIAPLEMEEL